MKKLILFLFAILILIPVAINATAEVEEATAINLETGHRKVITVGDPHAFDGGYVLELFYYQEEDELTDDSDQLLGYTVVTDYKTTVNIPMSISQDYIPVSSLKTRDDHTLTIDDVDRAFFMVEPGKRKEEIILCTGINPTTVRWTSCTRGLAFYGKSLASVQANRKTHSSGSVVIMSNTHQVYDQLINKDDDQTVGGIKTFSVYPEMAGTDLATTSRQLITLQQGNAIGNQGAATSSVISSGISEQATLTEQASSTPFDSDNPHYKSSENSTSTPWSDAIGAGYDCVTEDDGNISADCLPLSEDITYTGDNIWTGENISTGTTTLASTTTTNLTTGTSTLVTTDQLVILSDGSNADSLHIHSYSELLMSTTTPAPYDSADTVQLIATSTLPANKLSSTGVLHLKLFINRVDITSGNSTAFMFQWGTNQLTGTISNSGTSLVADYGEIDVYIIAKESTNNQTIFMNIVLYDEASNFATSAFAEKNVYTTSANQDTTSTVDYALFANQSTSDVVESRGGFSEVIN